jgi:hypothetical protein
MLAAEHQRALTAQAGGNLMPKSFATDIRPLFRTKDIDHMRPLGVLLDDYDYMKRPSHAAGVLCRLQGITGRRMPPPPDPPWSEDQINLFKQWMDDGFQP